MSLKMIILPLTIGMSTIFSVAAEALPSNCVFTKNYSEIGAVVGDSGGKVEFSSTVTSAGVPNRLTLTAYYQDVMGQHAQYSLNYREDLQIYKESARSKANAHFDENGNLFVLYQNHFELFCPSK
jgi:hypothetical protein